MYTEEVVLAHQEVKFQEFETVLKKHDLGSFLGQYVNFEDRNLYQFRTTNPFNIEGIRERDVHAIINYKRCNDARYINKLFEAVNRKLSYSGTFVCCVETLDERKASVKQRYPGLTAYPILFIDFMLKRVWPKLPVFNKLYFHLTKGHDRIISLSETLGRLVSCGFNIITFQSFNHLTYIVCEKIEEPSYDMNPTYGFLIGLNRIGLNGKKIKVYKIRTMHPYSEYLQEYIFSENNLTNGGKFKDDFRVTNYGKIFRKFWIDELPMLYNWIKGDLKLFGVRPLSKQYFKLYPSHVQERRINYKPGLIPPFYVDLPGNLDEIVESELRYMDAFDKNPFVTDFKYCFKALGNILFKKARSS